MLLWSHILIIQVVLLTIHSFIMIRVLRWMDTLDLISYCICFPWLLLKINANISTLNKIDSKSFRKSYVLTISPLESFYRQMWSYTTYWSILQLEKSIWSRKLTINLKAVYFMWHAWLSQITHANTKHVVKLEINWCSEINGSQSTLMSKVAFRAR